MDMVALLSEGGAIPNLNTSLMGTKPTAPRQEWRSIAEVGLISHKTHALFVLVKTLIQMIGNKTRMHFLILQVVVFYSLLCDSKIW
jgi:hypothetical protein